MEEEYRQDAFPGFFDDKPVKQQEITPISSEPEELPDYYTTQQFLEGIKNNDREGLRVSGNPRNSEYVRFLERDPLRNIVTDNRLLPIVRRQIKSIVITDWVPGAKPALAFITAGEFMPDGSFIGVYRNTHRDPQIPAGEEMFRGDFDHKCHLVRTDSKGNTTTIRINLPKYGVIASPERTMLLLNNNTSLPLMIPGPNEYAKEIAIFEKNPSEAEPGTLNNVFKRIVEDNFKDKVKMI